MSGGVEVGAVFERDGVQYQVAAMMGGAPGWVLLAPLEEVPPDDVDPEPIGPAPAQVAIPDLLRDYVPAVAR